MLFDVYQLFDQSPQKVDAALGRPVLVKQGHLPVKPELEAYYMGPRSQSREYIKSGATITVWFYTGKNGAADSYKANTFGVLLPAPAQSRAASPEEAVAMVGVDVRGRRPVVGRGMGGMRRIWRGAFKHPGIKQVSAQVVYINRPQSRNRQLPDGAWNSVFVQSQTSSLL